MNYTINKDKSPSSYYNYYNDTIELGLTMNETNNLTDDELIILMSDIITHEFMHKILTNEFNNIVSALFDAVGDYFHENHLIFLKSLTNTPFKTWSQTMKIDKNVLFKDYGITKKDYKKAKKICDKRTKWYNITKHLYSRIDIYINRKIWRKQK